jgi:hypothetical protein
MNTEKITGATLAKDNLLKASKALYLELPSMIADDVKEKVLNYIQAVENQPTHISVDDLYDKVLAVCKANFEFTHFDHTPTTQAIAICLNTMRELLSGHILLSEQAISDLWDTAIFSNENAGCPADDLIPDKATYLKEHFKIEPK